MAWSLVLKQLQNMSSSYAAVTALRKQLQNRSSSYAAVTALRAVAASSPSYHHRRLINTQSFGPAAPVSHGPAGYNNLRGFSAQTFLADACNRFSTTRKLGRLLNKIMSTPDATNGNTMRIQPARSEEDSECLYLYLHMYGNVKISANHNHGTVYVEARDENGFVKFYSWIDLPDIDSPDKVYKACDIKAEMARGELKLTIPKLKEDEKVYGVNVEMKD